MSAPRHKGVQVELAGSTYTVPPLTLGALEEFQAQIEGFEQAPLREQIATVIGISHRALARNYPELTRDQVAEMVDVNTMFDLFLAVMRVSGLLQGAAPDPKALQTATLGSGPPSTPISPPAAATPSSTAETT